jgi:predicted transcriptional regulator
MTTATEKRLEAVRRRNEMAIRSAERRSAELQESLRRSRTVTQAALETLKRAGYVKK